MSRVNLYVTVCEKKTEWIEIVKSHLHIVHNTMRDFFLLMQVIHQQIKHIFLEKEVLIWNCIARTGDIKKEW